MDGLKDHILTRMEVCATGGPGEFSAGIHLFPAEGGYTHLGFVPWSGGHFTNLRL